jgi:HPt (histidine-containing phosphotransfer) domain-containing protein
MCNADLDQLLLIDDEVIAELRDVMQEDFIVLIHHFVSDAPLQFDLLQAAIDERDADGLYRIAHKFKSSCGSIGVPRLAELIRRLEQAGRQKVLDGAAELLARAQAVATETVAGLQVIIQSPLPVGKGRGD